jgi:predicted nucleic-acid-binding protein
MGGRAVRITPDTNLLVRAITRDDPSQAKLAEAQLAGAELVAISAVALCELVWVLSHSYKTPAADIAEVIRALTDADNVEVDRRSLEAGLAFLDRGGDFADGVIAHQGYELGGDVFVSFDKKAVGIVEEVGEAALLLG